jgi:16S rRNA (cytosine1402-N4)-methyltransferase
VLLHPRGAGRLASEFSPEAQVENEQPRPSHLPVMLAETLDLLAVKIGGTYIDATVGLGGHAEAILDATGGTGRLLAIDRDPAALAMARARLKRFGTSVKFVHGNLADVEEIARKAGFSDADGVLMDLGVSSLQLDDPDRGFSFRREGALDMRMDPTQGTSAADIVNNLPENELADILWRYGEERRSRRIAREIVRARPIRTTTDLARLVERAVGRPREKTHPATNTFLGLRLYVNGELDAVRAALPGAHRSLGSGGRLAVISFHSLEDRIVKEYYTRESRDCLCPPALPVCRCGHVATLRLVNRRVRTPSAAEVARNPRSRSAHLRVAEVVGESREAR